MAVLAATLASGDNTPWLYSKWVQPPAQGRSERTFFRFLDAAEGLLAKRHWHEVSVQQIVKKADASVGSFYNRFADKDALLHCLDDRLGEECEATIEGLINEFELVPELAASAPGILVSLLMRLCTERTGVIRALDIAVKMSDGDSYTGMGPRFEQALTHFADFMHEVVPAMSGHSADTIVQAFKETFWVARENLLYQQDSFDDAAMHKSLMRHFEARLDI
jgi:AcrR family transcriptional regulator